MVSQKSLQIQVEAAFLFQPEDKSVVFPELPVSSQVSIHS